MNNYGYAENTPNNQRCSYNSGPADSFSYTTKYTSCGYSTPDTSFLNEYHTYTSHDYDRPPQATCKPANTNHNSPRSDNSNNHPYNKNNSACCLLNCCYCSNCHHCWNCHHCSSYRRWNYRRWNCPNWYSGYTAANPTAHNNSNYVRIPQELPHPNASSRCHRPYTSHILDC